VCGIRLSRRAATKDGRFPHPPHCQALAAVRRGRTIRPASFALSGCCNPASERLYPQILWVDVRAGLESGFALLFDKLFPGGGFGERLLLAQNGCAGLSPNISVVGGRPAVPAAVPDLLSLTLIRPPTSGAVF